MDPATATTPHDSPPTHRSTGAEALAVDRQLAEAVRAVSREGAIDVTLSPEELGKVRLTLHHDPQGLRVEVIAERAETIELIRRHLAELDRDLRGLGHGTVTFSFGDPPPRAQREDLYLNTRHPEAEPKPAAATAAPKPRTLPVAGLDIRL